MGIYKGRQEENIKVAKKKMGWLHTNSLLLLAFFNTIINAQNLCSSSHCGRGSDKVHYPFVFENEPPSTDCTYINLNCSRDESTVAVNLPGAGEFHVQRINYADRYIQLYDPGDCLIRRLFDLRLDSSPFTAKLDNYTLYLCPFDADVDPIICLSSSNSKVTAVRESFKVDHQCRPIQSGMLPVEHDETFFYLKWSPRDCVHCKDSQPGSWRSKLIAKIIAVALTLPGVIIMALSCCSIYVMKVIRDKYASAAGSAPAAEAQPSGPTPDNGRLDESKILDCIELVIVGESNEGSQTANSKTCSICLENYIEKETISMISKCEHSFHPTCILQWLRKNATCPVCRTSLSGAVVPP